MILNFLAEGNRPVSVGEIVDAIDVGQSTVSHHIRRQRPPDTGIDLFKFMPFPFYGDDQVGEAVAGENVTYLVKG